MSIFVLKLQKRKVAHTININITVLSHLKVCSLWREKSRALFRTSVQSNQANTTKHQWYDFQLKTVRRLGSNAQFPTKHHAITRRGHEIAGEICKTESNNGGVKPSSEHLSPPNLVSSMRSKHETSNLQILKDVINYALRTSLNFLKEHLCALITKPRKNCGERL